MGLFLVSKKILLIYFPMIPRQSSWIPPINKIMTTREGHPAVGSPNINARSMMINPAIMEITNIKAPVYEAIDKGISEKLIIPSTEYLNKLQKDQVVLPATLSLFSNSRYIVLNPTHENNPFEKRLYSVNSRIAFT